jgi:nucleotide-binding universal stress UspA family protein
VVEFKRILCPVDLSDESIRPLAYADAIAKWYDAGLTVLHVAPTFDPLEVQSSTIGEPVQFVYPMSRDQILDRLRAAADSAGVSSDAVGFAAITGDAPDAIVDHAVAVAADLLVMGTHGRSGFNRWLLGSVTEKVLRKAPCPVLTVPPHAPAIAPAGVSFHNILCPMDYSPSALLAFGFALDLARQAGASVTLLQVIESLAEEEPLSLLPFDATEYRQLMTRDGEARLQALVADEPRAAAVKIETTVVIGRAYREILRVAAEQPADLIVMGVQGRGGPALALFGSTTQQVVRAAHCPVMTVRGETLTA